MHIKQVIIRGFKTYKDQVNLGEDFSKSVNVVVGYNGSGKSNFFNAILFVISDHYGTLRAEMRKSLLHEGSGPAVVTAFVEIIFDNCDRRMPIDKDEVRVRRTIAVKKDEYSLDGKHATRNEVFSLLESCGFTKSNPYYIVQQGKIMELTLMSDRRRLDLVKEISGASVFDDRRAESEKILAETQARRLKTKDIITDITKRIKSLEDEQRELVEYQQLERQRKCLEYELTDREWRGAQEKIDELEVAKRDEGTKLHSAQRDAAALRSSVTEADAEVQQVTGKRQRVSIEHKEAERARGSRLEDLTRARLELDDERKRVELKRKSRNDATREMEILQNDIDIKSQELDGLRPAVAAELGRRREVAQRKQVCEARRDLLLAKQGRKTQYGSTEQRNKALNEELARRRERRDKGKTQLKECEAELRSAEGSAMSTGQAAAARRKEMQQWEKELSSNIAPDMQKTAEELEEVTEMRRSAFQDKERLTRERDEMEREVGRCVSRIESTMPRAMRNALSEVKRWVVRSGLQDRVHGTLLDNIMVPEAYNRAAENTAGNGIFNLLVADDDIAGQIVTVVRKGNLGSVVCTPLSQVASRPRTYPQIQGVKPLVELIRAPPFAMPAVHQVFGKTVVCQTLELCDEVSRKYALDAITLEGDKVSSRGTLTGGYQDPSRFVRLAFSAKQRQARQSVDSLAQALAQAEEKAQEASERLEELHGKRRSMQDGRGQRRVAMAQASENVQEAEGQALRFEEAARRHLERKEELVAQIAEAETAIGVMEAELRTTSLGELSPEEESQLKKLVEELKGLNKTLDSSEERCHQLTRQLQSREQHLQEFLKRRLHELQTGLFRDSQEDQEENYQEKTKIFERVEREYNEFGSAAEVSAKKVEELDALLSEKKALYEKLAARDQIVQATINEHSARLDAYVVKANALAKKRSEADEKLRGLTVTSADMPKYKRMDVARLTQDLNKTAQALQKFEHVNKKAIDQFTTFTDQLQDLQKKETELDESRDAIETFIRKVDEQKEETLLKTLKEVDAHFSDIFADLARGGCAKMRMLQGGEVLEGDNEEETPEGPAQSKLKGVRIEVSFTGQSTSFLTMAQLSGGQKTVVAIALVFAIQRLEPAPFYLFDEIDAALDTQYRTAVARLIARDAKNAQMVITTFRPEIIETADKFYRVFQKNRVSRIDCVPRHEAKRVIEQQSMMEGIDG